MYHYDRTLIHDDVHERSIAHRLAVHLSAVFYEWDVDVEYNRDCGDVKRIYDHGESREKSIFPDIIVHKRGTKDNLLVIEIKNGFLLLVLMWVIWKKLKRIWFRIRFDIVMGHL